MAYGPDDEDAADALGQGHPKSRKAQLHGAFVNTLNSGTDQEELDEEMDQDDGEAGF